MGQFLRAEALEEQIECGDLNCGSEAALLVAASAEVAGKRNIESGERLTSDEGSFKRAESYLFLRGTIISLG